MKKSNTAETIPNHLVMYREQYSKMIDEHFACVSPKAVSQMKRALDRKSNRFWSEIILPNIILDSNGGNSGTVEFAGDSDTLLEDRPIYIPLAEHKKIPGRNQELAQLALLATPESVQEDVALFANPLRFGRILEVDDKGKEYWDAPSERVVAGRFVIFTIEYDPPSEWELDRRRAALDLQLGWFRKSGTNDLDRPIRPVWDWASQFSDFRGICANWSGHKSVHIHFIFNIAAVMERNPSFQDRFRDAYQRLWDTLSSEMVRVFPQEFTPDTALRLPEQYRKLPNGRFTMGEPTGGHILEIPVGTRVPLLCLWEKILDRAPAGADRAFVNEGVLKSVNPKPPRAHRRSIVGNLGPAEDYCSKRFNAKIAELAWPDNYPKGGGLHWEPNGWVGRLFANEFDQHPSTVILENDTRMFVRGGKQPSKFIELSLSLGFLIRKWANQYASQLGSTADFPGLAAANHLPREPRPAESQFEASATTAEQARQTLFEMVPKIVKENSRTCIRAPEGIGKTTAIFTALPNLVSELTATALQDIPIDHTPRQEAEKRRPSAVAFSSYELAEEKATEFNRSAAAEQLFPVVFPSFSRLYQDCADANGVEPLTLTEAAQYGHRSLTTAIKQEQPEVWDEMERRHKALHAPNKFRKRIVYFIAHQVLRNHENRVGIAFLHPEFFSVEPSDWWRLADEMRFLVVIHDEIPIEAIVSMHRAGQVEWCLDMFEKAPEVWADPESGLVDKFRSFSAKAKANPQDIFFEEVLEIHRANYRRSDQTEVAGGEAYGSEWLYAATHGSRWFVRKCNWWVDLADRTVFLTTEALPTEMIRALEPDDGQFEVFDLRVPRFRSGQVDVTLRRSCSSADVKEIVEDIRDKADDPDLVVITNRAAEISGTFTHAGVRGSNALTGKNLAQTAFFKSPSEYEQLQVINRLFGLTVAIRLRHVDEINQSAGRNLGFRYRDGVQTQLVLGSKLFEQIEPVLQEECRYEWTLIEDAQCRKRKAFSRQRRLYHDATVGAAQMDEIAFDHEICEREGMSDARSCGDSTATA